MHVESILSANLCRNNIVGVCDNLLHHMSYRGTVDVSIRVTAVVLPCHYSCIAMLQ